MEVKKSTKKRGIMPNIIHKEGGEIIIVVSMNYMIVKTMETSTLTFVGLKNSLIDLYP